MDETWSWLSIGSSFVVVCAYELYLAWSERRDEAATARSAHRVLRREWVQALSKHSGSELIAVQALRNSLMSATITASTAALSLLGALNLMVPVRGAPVRPLTASSLALELGLVLTLFATYVCASMAMRYYHHAGFAMSLPVGSAERRGRERLADSYVQRAGFLYSWSLRCFLFAAPMVVGMLSPLFMPLSAVALVLVLAGFDRAPRLDP